MSEVVGKCLLVLTNMPDRDTALALANTLVGKRLAACVNILTECSSVYRWRDGIQTEQEVPVLIKTHAARYGDLQQEILAQHPYELPEIIAFPIERGLDAYLGWVATEVNVPT